MPGAERFQLLRGKSLVNLAVSLPGDDFDIGLFFDRAGDPIESQNPIKRGRSFAFGQLRYLIQQRQWKWIPLRFRWFQPG